MSVSSRLPRLLQTNANNGRTVHKQVGLSTPVIVVHLNLHCSLNQLLLWDFLTHIAKKSQVRPSLKARSHSIRVQVKSELMILTTYICREAKTQVSVRMTSHNSCKHSCDDRVVKVLDLKSNGVSPRRFEPCSQRNEPVLTFKTSRDIWFSADLENHWP